jgi:hypothetical protein
MTNDEIRNALVILKPRMLNVAPLEMTGDRHADLIALVIDAEGMLRGFKPMRSRAEIVAEIERELTIK